MSKPILEFRNLTKIYSIGFWGTKQTALDQLTLSVPEGNIYGFLGANGAGKTTAIKLLMGLQFANSGEALVWGIPCNERSVKARIGFLPERPYFHENMTSHEFLDFHRNLFGNHLSNRKLRSNNELLKLVGLDPQRDKLLKNFSKGMLQRIGVAQALVNDPDLVVLDEPMSGLDPVGRKEVKDLIFSLGKMGKTVFFSTHILHDAEALCHRLAFLKKGKLVLESSMVDLLNASRSNWEVGFSGIPASVIANNKILSKAETIQDISRLTLDSEDHTKSAIEEIWKNSGKLLNFQAKQSSLEEILYVKEQK